MIPKTVDELEQRLSDAISVFSRLPGLPYPQGYSVNWPDVLLSWEDHDWSKEPPRPAAPHPSAIDRAEEAMTWFRLLPIKDEGRLLLERAAGKSFVMMAGKKIGRRKTGPRWQFHANRPARPYGAEWLSQKHKLALAKLLKMLRNGAS